VEEHKEAPQKMRQASAKVLPLDKSLVEMEGSQVYKGRGGYARSTGVYMNILKIPEERQYMVFLSHKGAFLDIKDLRNGERKSYKLTELAEAMRGTVGRELLAVKILYREDITKADGQEKRIESVFVLPVDKFGKFNSQLGEGRYLGFGVLKGEMTYSGLFVFVEPKNTGL
jgi:hypothetical protein